MIKKLLRVWLPAKLHHQLLYSFADFGWRPNFGLPFCIPIIFLLLSNQVVYESIEMKIRYPLPLLFRVQCNTTTIMFNSFLHISQQNPKENGKRNTWQQYKLTSRLSGIFYGLLSQGNFHIIKNESNRGLLKMHFYPPWLVPQIIYPGDIFLVHTCARNLWFLS